MIIILNLCYYTDVLGVGALTNHLSKHHRDVWETYVLKRDAKKTAVEDAKKSEQCWSTDFSESGKSASIVVVELIIAPSS